MSRHTVTGIVEFQLDFNAFEPAVVVDNLSRLGDWLDTKYTNS